MPEHAYLKRWLAFGLVLPAVAWTFPRPETPFDPPSTFCLWTSTAPLIDGRPDEACWQAAPWTSDFVDIRGAAWPPPWHRTRARLLWDDKALYVAAELEEPGLWATFRDHDAVIYHEHDFEIFLDPDGDNHAYYELEVNALNTTWDLFLTMPYRDEGLALNAWEITGLQTAVALRGTLNQPGDVDRGWTVEMALPWSALKEAARRGTPPQPGDAWRLNFSRVEWRLDVADGAYVKRRDAQGHKLPEENWVWAPQGLVAMHYPERWGFLRFVKEGVQAAHREWDRSEQKAADTLMRCYYDQRDRLEAGQPWAAPEEASPVGLGWGPLEMEAQGARFLARTRHQDGRVMSVDETGRLRRVQP